MVSRMVELAFAVPLPWSPSAPASAASSSSWRFGSGSSIQAKTALARHRPAASSPGAAAPQRAATSRCSAPSVTPALVAADTHPSAFARSACGTTSLT